LDYRKRWLWKGINSLRKYIRSDTKDMEYRNYLEEVVGQLKIRCKNAKSISVSTDAYNSPCIMVEYRAKFCRDIYNRKLCSFDAALEGYNVLAEEVYKEFGHLNQAFNFNFGFGF
jgi:hypothetical protein